MLPTGYGAIARGFQPDGAMSPMLASPAVAAETATNKVEIARENGSTINGRPGFLLGRIVAGVNGAAADVAVRRTLFAPDLKCEHSDVQ